MGGFPGGPGEACIVRSMSETFWEVVGYLLAVLVGAAVLVLLFGIVLGNLWGMAPPVD